MKPKLSVFDDGFIPRFGWKNLVESILTGRRRTLKISRLTYCLVLYLFLPRDNLNAQVRRWRLGDVPDRFSKELLHGYEETGPQEATQDDPSAHQFLFGALLRYLHVEKVIILHH